MTFKFLRYHQQRIVQAGLADKTDFNDWGILYYLSVFQNGLRTTGKIICEGEEFYQVSLGKILRENPVLPTRTKAGLAKRIQVYRELGLLKTIQPERGGKMYFRLAPLAVAIMS